MKSKKRIKVPSFHIPLWWPDMPKSWRNWLPSRGNVLFTLLAVVSLVWATNAGAIPLRAPAAATTSTGTIAYQGRLADSAGTPITETVNMEFRLYDVAEAGAPLWSELWTGSNAVRVSDGLFNVMLGSLEPIPQDVVAGHDQLWLGITVGTDEEMTPRVQLGNVPYATTAKSVVDRAMVFERQSSKKSISGTGFRAWTPYSFSDWVPPTAKAIILGVDFHTSSGSCNRLLMASGNEPPSTGNEGNAEAVWLTHCSERVNMQVILGLSNSQGIYYKVGWISEETDWNIEFTAVGYIQ